MKWSSMHLCNTSFVPWLFYSLSNLFFFFIVIDTCFVHWLISSLNNLFFLIVTDNFEEKLELWYIVKYDSIEWLFTDWFCLIIWYSTGSCLSCYSFRNEEIDEYKPLLFLTFHSVLWYITSRSINIKSTWIFNQLTVLEFFSLKWFLQLMFTQCAFLNSLVISSQIKLLSRFYSKHSNLYHSVNLFVYSFLYDSSFQHSFPLLHSGFIAVSWSVYLWFTINL